ncbi:MAG: MCE family protein, partial [Acidobacteria bacterium]|nr:MCE family protein [Acidobacteriota bacterium]
MPQRKQILWSQLKVGVLTVAGLTLLAIAIFLVTGQIGFFTKTMMIRTLSPDAGGLKNGAPVRLAGVDVGTVRGVQISGLPGPSQAVEIVMQVSRAYQSDLRTDSEAFLVAEGLLGERYVNISKGSTKAPPISPGGVIPFHATAEFSELVGGSRDLLDNLNVLTTRLNSVVGKVDSGEGTVGKLIREENLYRRLDTTVSEAQKLVADLSSGKGSLGRLLASDEIYE